MYADKAFLNGEVITVDREDRVAEAVAIKGNRIMAVGKNEAIKPLIHEDTEIFDLKGRSLLPGFIDSHLHITMYGTNKLGVSCKEPNIHSIDDILRKLKNKAAQTPKGHWVRAWGFNELKIKERRYPTRQELDDVSRDHPIIVVRTCTHISVVNSKALERANIDQHTAEPPGGKIGRDKNGIPNGILIETAHMHMFETAKFNDEELLSALKLASNDLISAGITSLHEAGGYGPDNLRVLQQSALSGDIKVRINAIVCSLNKSEAFVEKMIQAGVTTGLGNEKFKIGPAKIFTDGSSTGPTIATRKPYTSDPQNCGILYYSQEEINNILIRAHQHGFQITAHAQGDQAVEMVLNTIEKALTDFPRTDHRHRIEHAGITTPDLLARMKDLNVIPIPNPPFFYEFGDSYLKNYGQRVNHMYPVRDFVNNGIISAAGSDCPVTHYDPLLGIHSAVNRQSQSGQDIGRKQRVSVLEAIRLYTWNGAYASFEEDIKGSIEVGKLADLTVLNKPLLQVPQTRIKDLHVQQTFIDGVVVYDRNMCGKKGGERVG